MIEVKRRGKWLSAATCFSSVPKYRRVLRHALVQCQSTDLLEEVWATVHSHYYSDGLREICRALLLRCTLKRLREHCIPCHKSVGTTELILSVGIRTAAGLAAQDIWRRRHRNSKNGKINDYASCNEDTYSSMRTLDI